MGGISLWHGIILFLCFVVPVPALGGLAWFRIHRARVAVPVRAIEARLRRLDRLRADGAITADAFQRQREAILRDA